VTAQNVFNGPVAYLPLTLELDPCCTVFLDNLLTEADSGTFGTFLTGTPTNPYPAISPDFTYVVPDSSKYTPIDGEFTIQNTMNDAMSNVIDAWWRISDRSTGNETGRMMIANEGNPGSIIFRTTVAVVPNQTYLFSTWIMNLFRVEGFPGPEFAVRILDEEGNALYESTLGLEIPVNEFYPVWQEIGDVIHAQGNSELVIEFFSEGEAAIDNDFAIDDIGLREILLPEFELVKTEDRTTAVVGDVVTYGLSMQNSCAQPLSNAVLRDFLPEGLTFVSGSVVINGVSQPTANPLIGFFVPDILGGTTLQVSFTVNGDGWRAWSGSYSLPSLASGESLTLQLRAMVAWNACGTIRNTAHVTAATADPNPGIISPVARCKSAAADLAAGAADAGRPAGVRPVGPNSREEPPFGGSSFSFFTMTLKLVLLLLKKFL